MTLFAKIIEITFETHLTHKLELVKLIECFKN